MSVPNLVRFDWAMKRLLRHKTNFVVLEGFLSSLLGEQIHIKHLLESEGNKEDVTDKFNRVDLLAENSKEELIIVEVQNNREIDYFLRMLYGVSKAVTEYIKEGDLYEKIRKIYSVNIVYFDLGQGNDYVYHGKTEFRGIHNHDLLKLSKQQMEKFIQHTAGDLFPEYYVLRVNEFNGKALSSLDEWVSFLKTGEISDDAKAPGLSEARERLKFAGLTKVDKMSYLRNIEDLRVQRSVMDTAIREGRAEGRAEGKAEGRIEGRAEGEYEARREIAGNLKKMGIPTQDIATSTGLALEEIDSLD